MSTIVDPEMAPVVLLDLDGDGEPDVVFKIHHKLLAALGSLGTLIGALVLL